MPPTHSRLPREALVVDDEPEVAELIGSYFSSLGVLVTATYDGRSAVATLERSPGRFELVVTDLSLPWADGFTVLHAAKEANPACHVVIVTGYATLESAIQAVRAGAYDYLAKPFSLGQLEVTLGRVSARIALEERASRVPDLTRAHKRGDGAWLESEALDRRLSGVEAALARLEEHLGTHPRR